MSSPSPKSLRLSNSRAAAYGLSAIADLQKYMKEKKDLKKVEEKLNSDQKSIAIEVNGKYKNKLKNLRRRRNRRLCSYQEKEKEKEKEKEEVLPFKMKMKKRGTRLVRGFTPFLRHFAVRAKTRREDWKMKKTGRLGRFSKSRRSGNFGVTAESILAKKRVEDCEEELMMIKKKKAEEKEERFQKELMSIRHKIEEQNKKCEGLKLKVMKHSKVTVTSGNEMRAVDELVIRDGWNVTVSASKHARTNVHEMIRRMQQKLKMRKKKNKKN